MKIFLDTNVLVSAFATRGLCADVFRYVVTHHELVLGETVLQEFEKVLGQKLKMPPADVSARMEFVRENAILSSAVPLPRLRLKDPQDRKVVSEAVASRSHYLVTGDAEILRLKSQGRLKVVSPRSLWEKLCRPA